MKRKLTAQKQWKIIFHWKYFMYFSGYTLLWWCLAHLKAQWGQNTAQIPLQIWWQYHQKWQFWHCFFEAMSRQFCKKDIWRLQNDAWKLNNIMGLMTFTAKYWAPQSRRLLADHNKFFSLFLVTKHRSNDHSKSIYYKISTKTVTS